MESKVIIEHFNSPMHSCFYDHQVWVSTDGGKSYVFFDDEEKAQAYAKQHDSAINEY